MKITNNYSNRVSFKSYSGAMKVWEQSKPIFNQALKQLGDKNVSLIVQGPSFPSAVNQDFGIGSPYSKGASDLKDFFDGIFNSIVLGPWGVTQKTSEDRVSHSPYLSTLESVNPFFIDFAYLTTKEGGKLLSKSTFEDITKNYNTRTTYKGNTQVDYNYAEQAVDKMLDEAYNTHLEQLKTKTPAAIKRQKQIDIFKEDNQGIIFDKLYNILKSEYNTGNFRTWSNIDSQLPILYEDGDFNAKERFNELNSQYKYDIDKYIFGQFLVQNHAQNNQNRYFPYTADKQVAIVGPDEWKLQDIILSEIDGNKITLGVPADGFSKTGRNWGMAVLDYTKIFDKNGNITKGGMKIKKIYQNAFKQNRNGLRIDHFIGIVDPYVCVNGSGEENKGAGRLYSSPNNPLLGRYAYKGTQEEINEQYSRFFEKIILDSAKENGLDESSIFPEDVGRTTPAVDYVMNKYNLSSMKITQFANPEDEYHKYAPHNTRPNDIITNGTHDSPPQITYIASLTRENYPKRAKMLSRETGLDEKIFYQTNGIGRKNALQAEFAALFASNTKNIHIFFPNLFGIDEYYNKPGDKKLDKWKTRIPNDFQRTYFENLGYGTALNPYSALSIALSKKGYPNDGITKELQAQEKNLFREINDMIRNESKVPMYNPFTDGVLSIKEKNKIFDEDKKYREILANKIGIDNPKKLKSVIGMQELKSILQTANSSYFDPNSENFCINLHIHTKFSDGTLKPENILDQAQEYAKRTGRPFIFAISDHDTIEGAQEAIKIIAENPEKYDKILFVPSVEINTKYNNNEILNYTIQHETLAYGINPFDEEVISFFDNIKTTNKNHILSTINELKQLGLDVSLEDAKKYNKAQNKNTHLRYFGSPGIIYDLKNYLLSKAEKLDDGRKSYITSKIEEIMTRHSNQYGSIYTMAATPETKDISALFKGKALLGLAHPARILLYGSKVQGDIAIKTLIDDFIKAGGNIIEYNYYYGNASNDENMQNWINEIKNYYSIKYPKEAGSGGLDCHKETILRK